MDKLIGVVNGLIAGLQTSAKSVTGLINSAKEIIAEYDKRVADVNEEQNRLALQRCNKLDQLRCRPD